MTIGEFKAFLEGMDVKGTPTPDQWARIKEKIEALEASIPRTVPATIPHVNPNTILLRDNTWYPFQSNKSVDGQVM